MVTGLQFVCDLTTVDWACLGLICLDLGVDKLGTDSLSFLSSH